VSVLGSLTQLTSLNLSSCESLSDLSGLGSLTQLTSLNLSSCESLSDLSGLGSLPQLTSLNLSWCKSLSDVSALGSLTQLNSLDLCWCEALSDVSLLGNLTQLTSLDLSWCKSLSDVSGLGSLTQLTSFNLSGSESLVDVSVLGSLTQLTSLKLFSCESLVDVSVLGSLTQLTSLNLSGCGLLSDVSVLGSLTQLTSLDLSGCESLSDVSVLGSLTQLTSLDFRRCESLSDVSGLGSLTQLTSLDLSDCESLVDVSGLCSLTQLTSLNLSGCKSLVDVSGLGSLNQLTSLNLSGCESLVDVSGLGSLNQLTSLKLSGCESLVDVSGLGSLNQLTSLKLSGCHRITKEPAFKNLSRLKDLEFDKHPCQIADILAHCAVSRKDWGAIQEHFKNWSIELGQAIQNRHFSATYLAISLAIGVSHLENLESTFGLVEILHKGSFLSHHPWKRLFHGTLKISGFTSLVELTKHLPENDWTSGAIGGLCSIVSNLKNNSYELEWFRDFIQFTHTRHYFNPAYLRPVAAQWCLALDELGDGQLLQEWLELLTDPADSTALDLIHLQFAKQALITGDPEKALKLSLQIQGPKIRDELLLELAEHYLHFGNAGQAGDLLFLVSHGESRSSLSKMLVAVPGYLDEPTNLHRILAAFGSDGEAIRLLSDMISVDKIVQALPREELSELLVIECMKMVSRGLGVSEAEAKQVLIQEVQKNSSIRNIHLWKLPCSLIQNAWRLFGTTRKRWNFPSIC
jgi:Leucine-rich repeat (LRR) protein